MEPMEEKRLRSGNGQQSPAPAAAMQGQSVLQSRRLALERTLRGAAVPAERQREVRLELCRILLDLQEGPESFAQSRQLLDQSIAQKDPETAAAACLAMYESGQRDSIAALGHGLWLAVACPISLEQMMRLVRCFVAETPADSDGAGVVAMLGYFLAEKRTSDADRRPLLIQARQLVAEVAKRQRGITDGEAIGTWVGIYELDNVDLLLERLRKILDAIVPEWWFDRGNFLQQLEGDA